VPTYSKIRRFRWEVAPLPKGKVRANNALGSCLSIPSKSRHKDAAWRYIKFLAGPEGQRIMVGADFSTPARKSIARSREFLQPPPQSEQVFVALKRLGVDTEFVRFPDEFHGLSRTGRTDRRIARLNHIVRWFEKYLV
jgi:ABC-type glycerol-3-phosphate transport system substrate-binding protein